MRAGEPHGRGPGGGGHSRSSGGRRRCRGNVGFIFEHADAFIALYSMELFYASAVALGVALAKPDRQVIAEEVRSTIGSPLLAGIQREQPANLTIVVTDNRVWGTGEATWNPPPPRTARISSCSREPWGGRRPSIARANPRRARSTAP